MCRRKLSLLSGLLAAVLALTACGNITGEGSSVSQSMEPAVSTIVPVEPPQPPLYTNPLTGLETEDDLSAQRPVAVMLNNLKKALPQCGVSQADIIYEAPAEGGITRMMGVFQSVDGVGEIGTVRSARPYYVELAMGLDAIFLHAGGSPEAYSTIKKWGVSALDCVNGPYEGTLFWRDSFRCKNAGLEHSVLTSGEKITELFPTYKKLRKTHDDGYTAPLTFVEDGTPTTGGTAGTITIRYSNYKTGVFRYDVATGHYLVEEYGAPYVDANNGQQVAVTNVLVVFTDVKAIPGDTAGRLNVRLTGTGSGYFACGGRYIPITWSKESETEPMYFFDEAGQSLSLGAGTSYINIVGTKYPVTIEG